MTSPLIVWALPRLSQLLPLDEDSLKQVITYTDSLPKDAAAEHLKNLLGDDAKSLEFISDFNLRRQGAPASSAAPTNTTSMAQAEPVRRSRPPAKKKANIHALPARQVEGHGNVAGAYQKRSEDDYMPSSSRDRQKHKDQVADNLALRQTPDATMMPLITDDAAPTTKPITSKPPPSAAGVLVSDSLQTRRGGSSRASTRTQSPVPQAKVKISGGTAMHGGSSALSDLDSAIRSLEVQTNPTLTSTEDTDKRRCNCMATRHPLLDMAPNCMQCGKIICVKEGLGPCTFCGSRLISSDDMQKVLRILKDERGEERMKANNASHKKAEVAQGKARAFTGRDFLAQASSARSSPMSSQPETPVGSEDEASDKAKAHRDKLLAYQANNARRTQIHDEAADWDVPSAGTNMWASPQERAQQLKKQQKILREMEWNAKPEFEKRNVVVSIDLKGGKVVRKMGEVPKPNFGDDQDTAAEQTDYQAPASDTGGAFSNNPLASGLIRPIARGGKGKAVARDREPTWTRVQMDADNEQWILDGGVYGGQNMSPALENEEPECG